MFSSLSRQPLWFHAVDSCADPAGHLCDLAAVAVAAALAVPVTELRANTRRPAAVAFARQSAMYLAHVVFGLTLTDVGRAFGRDRTTASHACGRVENLRDDPDIDALLEALECACGSLQRHFPELATREART